MGIASAAIREQALGLGFDAVGFTRPETGTQARKGLADFLRAGMHGDMGWMEAKADRRADPLILWPEARSVVVLGMSYGPAADPLAILDHPDRGAVSVYARTARDYHDLIKTRLKALAVWIAHTFAAEVKVFVDTAPVMEKPLAQAAGLGWQGKHTNLVSRDHGSWLFLGEVFTTLTIEPDAAEPDRCGSCSRCVAACPTAAFTGPYRLDARRCISYLTIEHKGHIPPDLRPLMGNRIYGCDDCLAVCPWNKFAQPASETGLLPRAELTAPRLADLAGLDDAAFREVFAGSPIKRTGRNRFVRNVLIAVGNSDNQRLAATAEGLLGDLSPLVRAAAVWALSRLASPERFAALAAHYQMAEADEEVRRDWERGVSCLDRGAGAKNAVEAAAAR